MAEQPACEVRECGIGWRDTTEEITRNEWIRQVE
jgi:hypothetical protein